MSTTYGPFPTGIPLNHMICNVIMGLSGTSSQQTIPHGLNTAGVIAIPVSHTSAAAVISQASDATNVYVTAGSSDIYDLLIFAIQ